MAYRSKDDIDALGDEGWIQEEQLVQGNYNGAADFPGGVANRVTSILAESLDTIKELAEAGWTLRSANADSVGGATLRGHDGDLYLSEGSDSLILLIPNSPADGTVIRVVRGGTGRIRVRSNNVELSDTNDSGNDNDIVFIASGGSWTKYESALASRFGKLLAPLNAPAAFTDEVTVPSPAADDNSGKAGPTSWILARLNDIVSPKRAPTPSSTDNDNSVATTGWARSRMADANIDKRAPTRANADDGTHVANTAHVKGYIGSIIATTTQVVARTSAILLVTPQRMYDALFNASNQGVSGHNSFRGTTDKWGLARLASNFRSADSYTAIDAGLFAEARDVRRFLEEDLSMGDYTLYENAAGLTLTTIAQTIVLLDSIENYDLFRIITLNVIGHWADVNAIPSATESYYSVPHGGGSFFPTIRGSGTSLELRISQGSSTLYRIIGRKLKTP